MQILCMSAVYRGRPNNTPIRGKHPTPLQSHIVKQTSTTNPQNTPQHSQQCSGCTYYAISRKTLCNCGCVRVCVRVRVLVRVCGACVWCWCVVCGVWCVVCVCVCVCVCEGGVCGGMAVCTCHLVDDDHDLRW